MKNFGLIKTLFREHKYVHFVKMAQVNEKELQGTVD
jgi:hypothetical protein